MHANQIFFIIHGKVRSLMHNDFIFAIKLSHSHVLLISFWKYGLNKTVLTTVQLV